MASSPHNDLAKCHGSKCNIRDGCDRYLRKEGDRQTWLTIPEHAQGIHCRHFEGVVQVDAKEVEERAMLIEAAKELEEDPCPDESDGTESAS